ncbi:MAG TPA: exodeoxyribonuclease VII large subunit [Candidatus Atribacteria bacterium]|nr:exodeoxyribonuclease VII large subunit [Candidatus Atribacteria bacterium]
MEGLSYPSYLTLKELAQGLKDVIEDYYFSAPLWVVAEIAEIRLNSHTGHCYLELVEKEDDQVLARMKGIIWASNYSSVSSFFQEVTGRNLERGMKVLFLARLRFHLVHGLSLDIKEIDPSYSLGEMMRKKREILERLEREGLLALNRSLPFPLFPQRVAVISSPTAAGWEDFVDHLQNNSHGFSFFCKLFPTLMQGDKVESSLLSSLEEIKEEQDSFDVVVIIRGGGSNVDLSCFDSYLLGKTVAAFSLPVLVGIGHERDDTVLDYVAHTSLKTPTAVAEFLVDWMRKVEEEIDEEMKRLKEAVRNSEEREKYVLATLAERWAERVRALLLSSKEELSLCRERLLVHSQRILGKIGEEQRAYWRQVQNLVEKKISREREMLERAEQAIRFLSPENVLRRGYSITYREDTVVKSFKDLQEEDVVSTRLRDGWIKSKVEEAYGRKQSEL